MKLLQLSPILLAVSLVLVIVFLLYTPNTTQKYTRLSSIPCPSNVQYPCCGTTSRPVVCDLATILNYYRIEDSSLNQYLTYLADSSVDDATIRQVISALYPVRDKVDTSTFPSVGGVSPPILTLSRLGSGETSPLSCYSCPSNGGYLILYSTSQASFPECPF